MPTTTRAPEEIGASPGLPMIVDEMNTWTVSRQGISEHSRAPLLQGSAFQPKTGLILFTHIRETSRWGHPVPSKCFIR